MGYFIFDKNTNNLALDEIHHIRDVLRLKPNTNIKATDGQGNLYELNIKSLKPFTVDILSTQNFSNDNIYIRCIIATIKTPLLELIIQKLTEIGIDEIIITKTKFAQISLDKLESKLNRWETIINTACKQSERVYFPKISIQNLNQIQYHTDNNLNLIGDTQYSIEAPNIKTINITNIKTINLLIGPEGGFDKEEYKSLVQQYNYTPITFAPNILRSETAAIVGAGILKNLTL
jgi:16S rRNA (uracil1498-N3)-methyltransferase